VEKSEAEYDMIEGFHGWRDVGSIWRALSRSKSPVIAGATVIVEFWVVLINSYDYGYGVDIV
jgi:hypothetical protein